MARISEESEAAAILEVYVTRLQDRLTAHGQLDKLTVEERTPDGKYFATYKFDAERIGEGASFVSLEFAKGAAAFQALQWLDRNGFPSKE
ncbi:hypothetical protein HETIRDRAFT_453755 [Heterobasidion irregulare TC 32-1]|uniref:Uncharacterized protein n=1 Tax=Heterobasidion irregulare (strain TC 32-1) TaxID=747525 RepID=W4K0T7_HETIT|nr:uncharacterized protein HETIRDRAFT_453755 [Heterobasidion irregulare TC 32-1]ETW79314.1 hypothetical protein HETIRDRAFT_453755 [Heterobasidion irregulare TC 32-1]